MHNKTCHDSLHIVMIPIQIIFTLPSIVDNTSKDFSYKMENQEICKNIIHKPFHTTLLDFSTSFPPFLRIISWFQILHMNSLNANIWIFSYKSSESKSMSNSLIEMYSKSRPAFWFRQYLLWTYYKIISTNYIK